MPTAPNEVQIFSLVIQGGSFAVLVCIILYVMKILVPMARDHYEKMVERFDSALVRIDASHEKQLERRDHEFGRLTDVVGKLADRVDDIDRRMEKA